MSNVSTTTIHSSDSSPSDAAASSVSKRLSAHPLFSLGRVVATPGAIEWANRLNVSLFSLLSRHVRGDDGDVDPEDHAANRAALQYGSRILSSYRIHVSAEAAGSDGHDSDSRIWIITEADRSVTTLLLPSEY